MKKLPNQGDLFNRASFLKDQSLLPKDLLIEKQLIESWQSRINSHQKKLFKSDSIDLVQGSLFKDFEKKPGFGMNPLDLKPLPINFWRWSKIPVRGPAIYLVMDKPENLNTHLLLYIGETMDAEKRWKGSHDCKFYIDTYIEALQKVNLSHQLSIRFWRDVPITTKERRKLEQELIQVWLPPFNKETRNRWTTTFTSKLIEYQ